MSRSRAPAGHHVFVWPPGQPMQHYRLDPWRPLWPTTPGLALLPWVRQQPRWLTWFKTWSRCQRQGWCPPDDRQVLRREVHQALSEGPSILLQALRRHFDRCAPVMTPMFREVVGQLPRALPHRSELLFHALRPDLYLWLPPGRHVPSEVLVCFCTRSNTLNMPLPLAHHVLAQLGMAVLYVYNRPGRDPVGGLAGGDFETSCQVLNGILAAYGFQRRYGLGTSMGGYAACCYAQPLGMHRVVVFSAAAGGAADHPVRPDSADWLRGFPPERVLAVLSRVDDTDRAILAAYEAQGFVTPRAWVESDTHGSFTAAWREGRLPHFLSWLTEA